MIPQLDAAHVSTVMRLLEAPGRRRHDGTLTCEYMPFGVPVDYTLAGVEGRVLLDCQASQLVPSDVYRSQCSTLHWLAGYRSDTLCRPTTSNVQAWGTSLCRQQLAERFAIWHQFR
ncbi:hypothetical protein [Paraburkholderia fungorum]